MIFWVTLLFGDLSRKRVLLGKSYGLRTCSLFWTTVLFRTSYAGLGVNLRTRTNTKKNKTFWSKVEITSGQIHDKSADIFSDPPWNDMLVPTGCPKVPQNDRIHFSFDVFSEFGPRSGLKSFGKITTFSWFWRSLFSHQLRHRFFIDFWRNWDPETNILRYILNGFAYTFHRNSASFCSREDP